VSELQCADRERTLGATIDELGVRMPGGRLTSQDRRLIADGLAEGLGYAEIARRLARPTSTVSREVARNGGLHGYRADEAARLTTRRARRRRSVPQGGAPAVSDAERDDAETIRGFEEQFVMMVVQTGLPRMAARVLACLYISDSASLTAAELVARLRVSPASISTAISYLEGLELVRRERDALQRRERYIVDADVWSRSWSASVRANAMWVETARRGVEVFGAGTPVGSRLEALGEFFERIYHGMLGGDMMVDAGDALTVLAALVHAAEPLTPCELAAALDWSQERVAAALRDAEVHPEIADPVALRRTPTGACTVIGRPDRLTSAQWEALDHARLRAQ
jgi:DNA-binding transcriptional regulator GbsR (MarR family)